MAVLCRFDQLRIKTDTQLLQLINGALALGICGARNAFSSFDPWASAEDRYQKAKRAYAEAFRWIPLLSEIPEHERKRLEAHLADLRHMLDGLVVLGHPAPKGDKTPTLARALWNASDCPETPEEDWFQTERALQSQPVCGRS
jgi:hypothetical protein